jgi:hypothetical protein
MTTIAVSQYRNAPRPCRSSIGHSAACSDRQFGPLSIRFFPINALPFSRNDPLSHRIGVERCARSVCRSPRTASDALKSP